MKIVAVQGADAMLGKRSITALIASSMSGAIIAAAAIAVDLSGQNSGVHPTESSVKQLLSDAGHHVTHSENH